MMPKKKGMMEWLGRQAAAKNKGEQYITYDPELAALAEGPEVFEEGYIDPRAIASGYAASTPSPPPSRVASIAAPIVAAQNFAKNYEEKLASDPEMQKVKEIEELDAMIEEGLANAQEIFDRRTGETPLPSETPAQMPVYGETPVTNQLQHLNKESQLDKEANQLTEVLKEMNKTVKMLAPQFNKGTDTLKSEVPTPKTQAPPPPVDQVGPSGMPDWATATPAPAPAPVPVREGYEDLIFSNEELQNIMSMTDADIPSDRMILPVQYNTMEEAAADFDRIWEEKGYYPPVIYVKNPPQYINIADDPEMAKNIMGPEELKLHNANTLLQIKLNNATKRQQEIDSGIQQINERL